MLFEGSVSDIILSLPVGALDWFFFFQSRVGGISGAPGLQAHAQLAPSFCLIEAWSVGVE